MTDPAGNTTTGNATTKITTNSSTSLFGFVFTYTDGKDYYSGTVADDGTFGYSVGQTISTSAGSYTVVTK